MNITRGGHIYRPTGEYSWSRSHAQVPFALLMRDRIRIFFATRDQFSRSHASFVDVARDNPKKIIYVHNKALFEIGTQGSFDDSGTMPSWFIKHGDELWMYYTAWNKSQEAAYRLSIGLAVSKNDGVNFSRMFNGPIMDRGKFDPIWVGQPCVIQCGEGDWKMWYLSCQKIEIIDNHPEPFYNVKYAHSENGIDWKRTNTVCIDFDSHTDAIGRPCVWKKHDTYFMLHSNRMARGYRKDPNSGYRIVMSSSKDGLKWTPLSDFVFKKDASGWDSLMNEYTSIIEVDNNMYLVFYNGNGFGSSGFGYFQLEL